MNHWKSILLSSCVLWLACGASPEVVAVRMPLVLPPAPLFNGVPAGGLSGDEASMLYHAIEVPPGATQLVVTVEHGTGDADLYVRHGALPSTLQSGAPSYDCLNYSNRGTEDCTLQNPQAGTWYILLHGYSAFAGATLMATYELPPGLDSREPGVRLITTGCPLDPRGAASTCVNPTGASTSPGLAVTAR